jgi:hypothetical protein
LLFCAPKFVFCGTEGVGSRFHVLGARNRFRLYQGRRVPISCFARPDLFSVVPRASRPVVMFCAPRLVFGFSCFGRPKSFLTIPRASGPNFMFCAPGLVFDSTERVGSRFHVLRSRTHFRRYRRRRVPFSCFARPDSFSAVSSASGPFFHVLRPWTRFQRCRVRRVVPRSSGPVFMFCAPKFVFCGTEGVEYRFHVLRARTRFPRYRGRQIPFSCVARPDSFSAVLWASGPVFMFCSPDSFSAVPSVSSTIFMHCVPGFIFSGTEGVGSRFVVLRSQIPFLRDRERRLPFSCFGRPESFSTIPRASGPVFMFCAPELVFGSTEGVGYSFHALLARTRFRRYRGRWVPFSCFAPPDSFSTVPRASGPVFMFCASRLVFGDTEPLGSRFHVLRSRTRFRRYRGVGSRFPVLCARTRF